MIAYAILFALGLWLNRADHKMLLLTVLVGASFFMGVPSSSTLAFYLVCIVAQLLIAAIAMALEPRTRIAAYVMELSLVMVAGHVMGWLTEGYAPLSPYKGIMFIAEHAQILVCVLGAAPMRRLLDNRLRGRA